MIHCFLRSTRWAALACAALFASPLLAEELQLNFRTQVETAEGSGRYHSLVERKGWQAGETAIVI